MHIQIENENRFVKSVSNRALINTDIAGLKEYKNKKEMSAKINDVSAEINIMKTEMAERMLKFPTQSF